MDTQDKNNVTVNYKGNITSIIHIHQMNKLWKFNLNEQEENLNKKINNPNPIN